MNLAGSPSPKLRHLSFNQDASCIALSDAHGLKIYNLDTHKVAYQSDLGAIRRAEPSVQYEPHCPLSGMLGLKCFSSCRWYWLSVPCQRCLEKAFLLCSPLPLLPSTARRLQRHSSLPTLQAGIYAGTCCSHVRFTHRSAAAAC